MAPYIFTERNGIYIIDLQKTVRLLEEAYMFVRVWLQKAKQFFLWEQKSKPASLFGMKLQEQEFIL